MQLKDYSYNNFLMIQAVHLILCLQLFLRESLRACTMVFNIEACLKGYFAKKKIVEPSLREEMSLARNPSSNTHFHFPCMNTLPVISIRYSTCAFTSAFINTYIYRHSIV
jgi:hypothetical protein